MSSSVSVRSLYDNASLGFCAPSLVSAMALPRPEPTIVQKVRIIEFSASTAGRVVEIEEHLRRRPARGPSLAMICVGRCLRLFFRPWEGKKKAKVTQVPNDQRQPGTTRSASGRLYHTPCPSLHHPSFARRGSFVRPHRVETHLVSRAKSRHTPINFRLSKHARSRRCAGRSSSSSVACI